MSYPRTFQILDKIYNILAKTCGAPDGCGNRRDHFINHFQDNEKPAPFHFDGALGGNATFTVYPHSFYVSCNPEKVTYNRSRMIEAANTELTEVYQLHMRLHAA